jgi:hypothetical protein
MAFILILSMGCSDKHDKMDENAPVPKSLGTIENLLDSFNMQYKSASSEDEKERTLKRYHLEIDNFLLDHYMNHIHVRVDSVRVDDLIIASRFHGDRQIVFKSSITFRKPMPPKESSLFSFMKGLKPGTDVSLDFAYMGNCLLNYPSDSTSPELIIFAYPLSFQMHNRHERGTRQ